ncbi:hypothetical protein H6F95_14665 [Cyanobacteria bacterium FACHB-471]|nr:hypothetical protein [Cyanobacteria bacterium FACHB-471]
MLQKIHTLSPKSSVERVYAAILSRRRQEVNSLSEKDNQIVDTLRHEGTCITSLNDLSFPANSRLLDATNRILTKTKSENGKTFPLRVGKRQIVAEYPEIFLWGLEERLLCIIESYFGYPAAFLGVSHRVEVPDGQQTGTRLWHLDGEDHCMIRVIVYLTDVGIEGGPFEYIPRSIRPTQAPLHRLYCQIFDQEKFDRIYRKISDADMQNMVPSKHWIPCTGMQGTVVLTDTANVFHRGKVPQPNHPARSALFFTYTSRHPKRLKLSKQVFPEELLLLMADRFTQRQRECVLDWR